MMPLMRTPGAEPRLDVSEEHVTVSSCAPRLSLDDAHNIRRQRHFLSRLLCCFDVTIQPDTIDSYSRVLFPVIFTVFNVVYWITYQNISQNNDFNKDQDEL